MNIDIVIAKLRRAVKQWRVPVVGHYRQSPFTVLISCLLSLRTQDKTTDAASARLFALAQTPQKMLTLSSRQISRAIYPVAFYNVKTKQIKKICRLLIDRFNGKVPDDIETLLELPGVGRKTANLVVTLGYGKPGICVDTHVHRIANRWGYVRTSTPDKTEMALRRKLPPSYWIEINELLVAYGQNLCTPVSPFCSRCELRAECRRIGVSTSR